MICITGAGGTVGRTLVAAFAELGTPVRAAYFTASKVEAATRAGIDAVRIDYRRPATLHTALEGCDSLFLLGPNVVEQTELELNVVAAAGVAGIRHVVKLSVMGAETGDYALARVHREVESALASSRMSWTFLRPNSFMQNVQTFMLPAIASESAFYTASAAARVAHVDVRDIAAVAVETLTGSKHQGRSYTLTGPEALTYDEVAHELSLAAGRTITHVDLEPAALKAALLGSGTPEEMADRLVDLERHFRTGGAALITDDVRAVTGRQPRTFASYIHEIAPLLSAAGGRS